LRQGKLLIDRGSEGGGVRLRKEKGEGGLSKRNG